VTTLTWDTTRPLSRGHSTVCLSVCCSTYRKKNKIGYITRDSYASCVLAMAWSSVCPSIRHTLQPYRNGASKDHGIFTVAASRTLVYCDEISRLWVRGFFSNEGVKEEYPPKRRYFVGISSYSVKTAADRYRHVAYHGKHWSRAFYFYQHR